MRSTLLRSVAAERAPSWRGATVKILIVDDDEVDRMAIRKALRTWSAVELVEVEDAIGGLESLQRESFDCALVDYRLPGRDDGLAVLRAARQAGVRTPVVVLTAHGDEETAVEMMKAGASDYIPKASLSPERLIQSLKNAIRLHEAQLAMEQAQAALQQAMAREQAARQEAESQRERLRNLFLRAQDLLAIVSHDLRNPLSAITNSAALLLKADTPEKFSHARASIERIARSADRMTSLVSELLDLARIESGTLTLTFETHEIQALVDEVLEIMTPLGQHKGVGLCSEVPPRLQLGCDKERVHQTLSNLIGNAIKFTPAGGTVTVRAAAADGGVWFSVADTGAGIPEEHLPHIFEQYWQAKEHKHLGVGLGLSIVKGSVEAHGGRVWVESEPGKGTTFHFFLPPQSQSPDETSTILVVDDDADIRTSIKEILEDSGYGVFVAGDGQQALDWLRTATVRPAAILLDVMMPVMDGVAFRAEQDKDPVLRTIPVVVFSAYGNVAQTAAAMHAAAHLRKPLRAETLLDTIRRVTQADAAQSRSQT